MLYLLCTLGGFMAGFVAAMLLAKYALQQHYDAQQHIVGRTP